MRPLDGEPVDEGFATLEEGHGELHRAGLEGDSKPADLRGRMHRTKRMMSAEEDPAKKEWFFDRLMAKYGEVGWTFEPGYPQINRIILYEQEMEIVTGKHSAACITDRFKTDVGCTSAGANWKFVGKGRWRQ